MVVCDKKWDEVRIVVDEPEFHLTGGAMSTVVCEISQGDASKPLAEYICHLHNESLKAEAKGAS